MHADSIRRLRFPHLMSVTGVLTGFSRVAIDASERVEQPGRLTRLRVEGAGDLTRYRVESSRPFDMPMPFCCDLP